MKGDCQNNATFPEEYSRVGSNPKGGEPSEGMVEARSAALWGRWVANARREVGSAVTGWEALSHKQKKKKPKRGSISAHRPNINGGNGLGASCAWHEE